MHPRQCEVRTATSAQRATGERERSKRDVVGRRGVGEWKDVRKGGGGRSKDGEGGLDRYHRSYFHEHFEPMWVLD